MFFGTTPKFKAQYPIIAHRIFVGIDNLGHSHTTNWLEDLDPVTFYKLDSKLVEEHNKEMFRAIKSAEICVFEITLSSMSVGYLVNLSLDLGKQVIVMTQSGEPHFVFSQTRPVNLLVVKYSSESLEKMLEKAIEDVKQKMSIRFNMLLPKNLVGYLELAAKNTGMNKSEYLRKLIEKGVGKK